MKLSFAELRQRVGAQQPTRGPEAEKGLEGLLGDEKPKGKRFYMEGDRLASFVEDFDKALDAEKTDAQFLRSWASLVNFEQSQEETVPGMLEFFTPEFRFWSTLGLAGLYVVVRRMGKGKGFFGKGKAPEPSQPSPQPEKPVSPNATETPKTVSPDVCEICQVELVQMGKSSGQCPSCQQIYFRKMEEE